MTPTVAGLIFVAFVLGCGVGLGLLGVWLAVREQRRNRDEVLLIKKPRPYVDPDGRSDFRPELREVAAAKREGR
jgi:hypothetical protein